MKEITGSRMTKADSLKATTFMWIMEAVIDFGRGMPYVYIT